MEEKFFLCSVEEMKDRPKRRFVVGEEKIMLAQVENKFYVVEDTCTHALASLTTGNLEGFYVECPRHGAKFDLRSGEVVTLPAVMPLKTFPVSVEDGKIFVTIEGQNADIKTGSSQQKSANSCEKECASD